MIRDQGKFVAAVTEVSCCSTEGVAAGRDGPKEPVALRRTPSMGSRSRYLSLDIWRGVACLMVLVLHASLYARHATVAAGMRFSGLPALALDMVGRMGIGVSLFFVISGYCIAASADGVRGRPRGWAQFAYRRCRRIFPPYWAALVLTIVIGVSVTWLNRTPWLGRADLPEAGIIPHPSTLGVWQWIGNIALIETWRAHVGGGPQLKVVGLSWTLCYEVQFYALCGLVLLAAPRHFFRFLAGVTLATLASSVMAMTLPWIRFNGLFLDGQWLLFAMGALIYYRNVYASHRARRLIPLALTIFVVALCVLRYGVLAHRGTAYQKDWLYNVSVGGAFAVILLLSHRWDLALMESRLGKLLALCGTISYSLYLIHYPLTKVLGCAMYEGGLQSGWATLLIVIPALTALSLGAGWIFYIAVEKRCLSQPRLLATTGQ